MHRDLKDLKFSAQIIFNDPNDWNWNEILMKTIKKERERSEVPKVMCKHIKRNKNKKKRQQRHIKEILLWKGEKELHSFDS